MNSTNDQKSVDEKDERPQSKSLGRSIKQKLLTLLSISLFITAIMSLVVFYMGTLSSPDAVAWAKTNRLDESSLKSFVAEYSNSEFSPDANSLISQIIAVEKRTAERAKSDAVAAEKARVEAIEAKKRAEEKAKADAIEAEKARLFAIEAKKTIRENERKTSERKRLIAEEKNGILESILTSNKTHYGKFNRKQTVSFRFQEYNQRNNSFKGYVTFKGRSGISIKSFSGWITEGSLLFKDNAWIKNRGAWFGVTYKLELNESNTRLVGKYTHPKGTGTILITVLSNNQKLFNKRQFFDRKTERYYYLNPKDKLEYFENGQRKNK